MVKLVAIYSIPENMEEFNQHYFETHAPLAKEVPGLIKLEVSKVYGAPMGESNLHLIAEMYFENKEALTEAMNSPEMRATGKDLMSFAGKIVSMHFAEVM
jgi:uncharacterized protein (TIGR02118 family)